MDAAQDVLTDVAPLIPNERLTLLDTISDGQRSTVLRVRADARDGTTRQMIVKS